MSASWIIASARTGAVWCETFNERSMRRAKRDPRMIVIPILEYLQRFNAAVKAAGGTQPNEGWILK